MTSPKKQFVHLHCHSHFSLLDGLPKIGQMVAHVKETGMNAVGLTDHGVMYGAYELYKKATAEGIKPIIGLEAYVAGGSMHEKKSRMDDQRYHLTLLARNNKGYQNLMYLTSKAHLEGFYYKPRIDMDLLEKHSEGLVILSGCVAAQIPRLVQTELMQEARQTSERMIKMVGEGNFFFEVQHHPSIDIQQGTNAGVQDMAQKMGVGLVATHDCHYLKESDAEAQDILLAVQTGSTIYDEKRMTLKGIDLSMPSPEVMYEYFKDTPEACTNTVTIAEKCEVHLDFKTQHLPHYPLPKGKTADDQLRNQCIDGIPKLYPDVKKGTDEFKEIWDRMEYELDTIKTTGYASYFLIVQDFINWAKDQGVIIGPGRGSAAGSLVAYLNRITTVDPIKYNLMFERFLNAERVSMPDIDVDIADIRRDEVINYTREKYGSVAQIITFGTMAAKQAIRDVGRAMNLPYSYCDELSKMIPMFTNLSDSLKLVPELKSKYMSDDSARKLIDYALQLEGVVRHSSVHASGVVVASVPLETITPLQLASGARDDDTAITTQFDMHGVEELGLLKMDFLGLRNLSTLEMALEIIEAVRGEKVDIEHLDHTDEKTFKLFQSGNTTGVFQLESSGMKRYLKELKPTNLEDIIVMVSLYRPGPMELIPTYIARKHGKEEVEYVHPRLKPILESTYGIAVYQDQLIRIANDVAGLSLPSAYVLIKAVGKKIQALLEEQKGILMEGMKKNGLDDSSCRAIWDFIEPFARYGFNRAHAACYAHIAYQTAYLKANYNTEYMAALLSTEGSNVERISVLIEDTRNQGIEVLPPDINESFKLFSTVGTEKRIRFGLAAIKNVGAAVVEAIIAERKDNGKFTDMSDFINRVQHKDVNKKSMESMIRAGVFDSLDERHVLLANLEGVLAYAKNKQKQAENMQDSLFGVEEQINTMHLNREVANIPEAQTLSWEKELLGLYISAHPMDEYKKILKSRNATGIGTIVKASRNKYTIGGVLSGIKKIQTRAGKPMAFAGIEDSTGKHELIIFPVMLEQYPAIWEEEKLLLITVKASAKGGELKLIAESVEELSKDMPQPTPPRPAPTSVVTPPPINSTSNTINT